ncbi:MAG: hypothetical protein K6A34_07345 [Methanobrevibacter sp.]|nr:hypothetical protein [Methanobrevibacter sp.]
MDNDYFNEVIFEKLRANPKGIVLELSNGNQKHFSKEDVLGCSIDCYSTFCIGDWAFHIRHIIAIRYTNPFDELQEVLVYEL